jgi:hypothetical protein
MAADLNRVVMDPLTQRTLLYAHPDAAGESVWSVSVETRFSVGATLACHYALHADMARVRLPGAGAGRHHIDGLWKHTCFEAFVAVDGAPGYFEFNFSPTLDWAAYHFEYYRGGMTVAALTRAPGLQVRRSGGQLDLTATVHLAGVASLARARVMRMALAAVVEEEDGRLSYWALQHAPGNPDFHHPDGFTLELRSP